VKEPRNALARYRTLAHALDAQWRVPGLGVRFGWDAVMGLLPGVGDAMGGLVGSYGLWVGWRLGAPAVVLTRMLLNLAVETVVGTIPLAGDLFDIGFRADLRNVALLDRWLEHPHKTRRQSRWLLVGLVLALVAVGVGTIAATLWLLGTLLSMGH
jgi:Domain of unknown function (DUF4112)